jgi:hypothetical protein
LALPFYGIEIYRIFEIAKSMFDGERETMNRLTSDQGPLMELMKEQ